MTRGSVLAIFLYCNYCFSGPTVHFRTRSVDDAYRREARSSKDEESEAQEYRSQPKDSVSYISMPGRDFIHQGADDGRWLDVRLHARVTAREAFSAVGFANRPVELTHYGSKVYEEEQLCCRAEVYES